MPRYPVYIISKGRFDRPVTARFLTLDRVPFHLVVEPQEASAYAAALPTASILTLPFSNLGLGSIPARNWVWEHSKAQGYSHHWILDDNIWHIFRFFQGRKIVCSSAVALAATEDFADRYENLAITGLNYDFFCPRNSHHPPFLKNVHVYSCLLIRNDLSYRWRGRYNEDTDLCLQVLSGGWCTALLNVFLIKKAATMTMKGGKYYRTVCR